MTQQSPMRVQIWSDVVCPWCYIGKRRLEAALAALPQAGEVEVVWRSFQLNPDAPTRADGRAPQRVLKYLGDKYGSGSAEQRRAQAAEMTARVDGIAAAEGRQYDQSESVLTNTLDAHRLLHAAHEHGGPQLQGALKERLLAAYFTQRQDIGDRATLLRLAVEAGLPEPVAAEVLDGEAFAEQVRADQAVAQQLGAGGVPFFVVDDRYGLSGAQPVEVFTQVLTQALADRTTSRR